MASVKKSSDDVARAISGVQRAAARLVPFLKDGDATVHGRAMAALVELGPLGVNTLIDTLDRSKDARLRSRVVAALGALAPTAPQAILTTLTGVLMHETDQTVLMMAFAAVAVLDPAVVARIVPQTQGPTSACPPEE
jgi:HEAT repeat protein